MVGRLFGLAFFALGALTSSLDKRQTVVQSSGNTVTISGVSSGQIIIIETNQGGGASWTQVNQPVTAGGRIQNVTVGGTSNVYSPETVNAAVGDIIQFNFLARNHTVTQSTFAAPCVNAQKFDTGFVPNPNSQNPPPAMRVQVNTTEPTWFYCRQGNHCGTGMVFSINPSASKTAAQFKAAAIAQGSNGGTGTPATPPVVAQPAPGVAPPSGAVPSGVAPSPPAIASSAPVAIGTGTTGTNGQCTCSCLCGSTAFGNPAAQGVAAFGGFGGMLSPVAGRPVR